jgi:hypothetical protein
MKDGLRFIAEKLTRRQPPLGTHEPNKPELCYQGEKTGHFQDVIKVPSGVIFEAPVFQEWVAESRKPKIDQIREELRLIAESARYSGDGKEL